MFTSFSSPRHGLTKVGAVSAIALAGGGLVPMVSASTASAETTSGHLSLRPGHHAVSSSAEHARDVRARADFKIPAEPKAGGLYLGVGLRHGSMKNNYQARAKVSPSGRVTVQLVRLYRGQEEKIASKLLPAVVRPGQSLRVHGTISGTTAVSMTARAWIVGKATPPVQVKAVDRSSSRITPSGDVPVVGYLSKSANGVRVPFKNVVANRQEPKPPTVTQGRPSASNTGVPKGTRLKRHDGDIVVKKAGTVLDSLDIHGFVAVEAPNVTIRNSIVRGGVAPGNVGLVMNYTTAGKNLVVEDSELVPAHPSVHINGINGSNFTARRVNVHGAVDGINVIGNNAAVVDSFVHDTVHYAHDPNQGGGPSHNDGVQIQGGSNLRIEGNSISGAKNAAIQVTQNASPVANVVLRDNFFGGGGCTVNLARRPRPSLAVTMSGNRFARTSAFEGCAIVATSATTVSGAGNVWDDTSAPVTVRRAG